MKTIQRMFLVLLLIAAVGALCDACEAQTLQGPIRTKQIENIKFANEFPGATPTDKLDNALAEAPANGGFVIVPTLTGAGKATSIPCGKFVLDLRNYSDKNFGVYTCNNANAPSFSISDNGGIFLGPKKAVSTQQLILVGVENEPFERSVHSLDGTSNGRGRGIDWLLGGGYDVRDIQLSRNLTLLYNTGTASVSNGSTQLLGAGTTWDASMVGRVFLASGGGTFNAADVQKAQLIAAYVSPTELTLTTAWSGFSYTGASYGVYESVFASSSGFYLGANNRHLWGVTSGATRLPLIGINDDATNKYELFNGTVVGNTSNGFVGIGTNDPQKRLHVSETSSVGSAGNIQIGGGTSATSGGQFQYDNTSSGRFAISQLNNAGGANAFISAGFGAVTSGIPATEGWRLDQNKLFEMKGAATVATTLGVTGISTLTGGMIVGGGSTITKVQKLSQAITPASVNANTCAEQTFTVTGLATTDVVSVNHSVALTSLAQPITYRASAANTIAITYCNFTAGALTPTASTLSLIATR